MSSSLLIVGDSLTVQARHDIEQIVADSNWTATINAENGRRLEQAIPVLGSAGPRTATVIALGTNNVGDTVAELERRIATVATAAPAGNLYWVDTYTRDGRSDTVNRALRSVRSRRLFELIEWASVASALPDVLADDGVHLSDDGATVWAGLVCRAVGITRAR